MTLLYDIGAFGFTRTNPGSPLQALKLFICGIRCPCDSNSHSQHPLARSVTCALTSSSCEGFRGLIKLLITFYFLPFSRYIPVRAFALRAYSRLSVNILRNPFMPAPLTLKPFNLNFNNLRCQFTPPSWSGIPPSYYILSKYISQEVLTNAY
jgi:hypothetical protein